MMGTKQLLMETIELSALLWECGHLTDDELLVRTRVAIRGFMATRPVEQLDSLSILEAAQRAHRALSTAKAKGGK